MSVSQVPNGYALWVEIEGGKTTPIFFCPIHAIQHRLLNQMDGMISGNGDTVQADCCEYVIH